MVVKVKKIMSAPLFIVVLLFFLQLSIFSKNQQEKNTPTTIDGTNLIDNKPIITPKTYLWWQPLLVVSIAGGIYYFYRKKNIRMAFTLGGGLFIIASYFLFDWLFLIGVDTGYQPIQPIEFSHKIHAGDNAIHCEYCHATAKHSKVSGLPTAEVCMSCHKFINEHNGALYGGHDKAFFDTEIAKTQLAAGWEREKFAYTSGGNKIAWIRIHNLPDFSYYNHSSHVTIAGLECQTCHGPVETMHRVKQAMPLTMKWCIDCHKTTPVTLDDNGYYSGTFEAFAKGHKGVTVADMGGRECGKCHY